LLDFFFKIILKKSLLIWFKDFIEEESYKVMKIFNKNINFFIPNKLCEWRVSNLFNSEPETLEWISKFGKVEKIIFWDIGANIGLYSIYAGIKHSNIKVISFEPSTSNLRILSRNISINKLNKKIKITPFALCELDNQFLTMKENQFIEGGALNTFNKNFDFAGKKKKFNHEYDTYGTSINYLLEKKILEIPNYIKIDVDGTEHLILKGSEKFLKNKKIKSILIEINENFKEQFQTVLEIMKKNNFIMQEKKQSEKIDLEKKFKKTYNYIFTRLD
tara:strand:- start:772 stop:1596 length:825 start_codon:yes stop_codon:yes gene_type:complete